MATFSFPNETKVNPLFIMASVLSMPDLTSTIKNRVKEMCVIPNSRNLEDVGRSIISDNALRKSLLDIKYLKLPDVWNDLQNLSLPNNSEFIFRMAEYLPEVTPSGNVYLDFEQACSHFLEEDEFKLSSNCSLINLKLVESGVTIANQSQSYMLETYYEDHVPEPMVEGLECSNLIDKLSQLDDMEDEIDDEYDLIPLIECFKEKFHDVCWEDQSEFEQDPFGNWCPKYTSNFKLICDVEFLVRGQKFTIPNVSVVLSPVIQNVRYGADEEADIYSGWCIHFDNWPFVVGSLFDIIYFLFP
jgi:hypothetical protein